MRRRGLLAVSLVVMAFGGGTAEADLPLANDPSCVGSAPLHPHIPIRAGLLPHPHPPVVLVHATAVSETSLAPLAYALKAAGYCPWTLNYPTEMVGDQAPAALSSFVGTVRSRTGASAVSMVGHSQGGMQIRHMLMHYPGTPVDDAISLAGSQKGSAHPAGLLCTGPPCPAGFPEQIATHPFYDHLNGSSCSVGGVLDDMSCWAPPYGGADYTNVTTVTDELMVPYWRALMGPYPTQLSATDPRVSDIVLQVHCPAAQTDHLGIASDPHVFALILSALGRVGPARPPPCAV